MNRMSHLSWYNLELIEFLFRDSAAPVVIDIGSMGGDRSAVLNIGFDQDFIFEKVDFNYLPASVKEFRFIFIFILKITVYLFILYYRGGNLTLPAMVIVREVWMELSGVLKDTGIMEVESEGVVTLYSYASTDPVPSDDTSIEDAITSKYPNSSSSFALHELIVKADGKVSVQKLF